MRDRYREEFRSELSELRWPAQMWQAGSIVMGAGALRHALMAREVTMTEKAHRDWRCRIGRHAYIALRDENPELYGRPIKPASDAAFDLNPQRNPSSILRRRSAEGSSPADFFEYFKTL